MPQHLADYTEDDDRHEYRAYLELSRVDGDTMTDAGIPARDLEPIGDASLTPGDPSPIGRTADGDLAYPVYRDETHIRISREDAARLANAWARISGIDSAPGTTESDTDSRALFDTLLGEALPRVFYEETGHGTLARQNDIRSLLGGDYDALRRLWI